MSVEMSLGELGKSLPFFRNEGKFTIISSNGVETGSYHVDTRPVQQYSDSQNPEWESHYKLSPEGQVIDPESEGYFNIPPAYRPEGQIFRLWELSDDLLGSKAKLVHSKIFELLRHNTPADIIDEEVRSLILDINQSDNQNLLK